MNKKRLFLILLLLLGIYGLSKLLSGKKGSNFTTDLIQVDIANINSLVFQTKADNFEAVKLQKQANQWLISKGNFTTKANTDVVKNMLDALHQVKAQRIVAKSVDKWADYGVETGKSSQIQVFENGKLKEDFLLGRMNNKTQARTDTAYIRLHNETEVYAIDGALGIQLNQPFDAYRNNQILELNTNQLQTIQFEAKDSILSFGLQNQNGHWLVGETPTDSTKLAHYFNTLNSVQGNEFVNNFDEFKGDELIHKKIILTATNLIEPITINCFQDTSRAKPFIIHSSQNPDAYFASDSTGVFTRLFKKMGYFRK